METNYFIKLNGSFNIPEDLKTGRDYEIKIVGAIPKYEVEDNEDGTFNRVYKLRAITGEILGDRGKSISLTDKRRHSVKFRGLIQSVIHQEEDGDPEEFYDRSMKALLANGDRVEKLIRELLL